MIHLDFTVSPKFLAFYCLTGRRADYFVKGSFTPAVVALQEKAARIDAASWNFLKDEYPAQLLREKEVQAHELSTKLARLDTLISKLTEALEFRAVLEPTLAAMNELRHDWEESLPRLTKMSDLLADGSAHLELKVFVSSPELNLEEHRLGDIYTGAINQPKYINCLHVWKSLVQLRLQTAMTGSPREIANQKWIANLIAALFVEEIRSQLFQAEFQVLPQTSDPNYSKAYVRDLSLLLPLWKEYMQSDQKKSLSVFRKQASDLLYAEWDKLKKK